MATAFPSTSSARSAQMRAIRSKDTKPELRIRALLHRLGYRYRVHYAALPGRPDIAFPRRKKVIFVHGCFWHRHDCRVGQKQPTVNAAYWMPKFERNKRRDEMQERQLADLGWQVLVVWECQFVDIQTLMESVIEFLGTPRSFDNRH
ncbi:very short patch repair endonuclease [Burkholderia thailandensis]|uniref:very short patch repair endonuclease n=1 Tax=Burkholderia thailandensis TaxID=57975 RepID=UPI00035FE3BB|nr:very short patch repair endonuclease [Burkholderia thailandensis]MCS3399942.1 very short patch repair endonuclease [Burkholderia thailandensis]MCS6428798.1 very short patch repair endonuclease [Burkholderia thailandensis]MCS6451513.1 very short patch repair endonuclease [Burkholderia thailandensis]MCS6467825.1 very short patch repair endonuclease [Burkholderia thailandensis]MCS6484217.1 very short patch repair endonuclease [Burkholderia thailandensis]